VTDALDNGAKHHSMGYKNFGLCRVTIQIDPHEKWSEIRFIFVQQNLSVKAGVLLMGSCGSLEGDSEQ
jgi:hypothetical protein